MEFIFGSPWHDRDKYFSCQINGWRESSQELIGYMQSPYEPIEGVRIALIHMIWWQPFNGMPPVVLQL